MSTLDPERLKGLLECSVCLDHYVDPKMLTCTHVFCKQCIESIAQFQNDGSIIVSCPMRCEQKTTLSKDQTVSDLTASYNFKNLLEALTGGEESDISASLCSYMKKCKKKPITSYCCGKVMCSSCHDKHTNRSRQDDSSNVVSNNNNSSNNSPHSKSKKGKKQNKNKQKNNENCSDNINKGSEVHEKISLGYNKKDDKLMLLCDEHGAFCTSVCTEDDALLCLYCQQRDLVHNKHTKSSIEEEVSVLKEILQTESDLLDRLQRFKTSTMQNVEESRKRFKNVMAKRKKDCLRQYGKLLDEEEARLTAEFEECCTDFIDEGDYDDCVCEYSKGMLKKHDVELFIQKEDIFHQLQSKERYETLRSVTHTLREGDFLSSCPLGNFSSNEDYKVNVREAIQPTQLFVFLPEMEETKGISIDLKGELEKECVYPTSLKAAQALKLRGNANFKKGCYTDARNCYSKAIEYCSSDDAELAVFYQNRAAVSEQLQEWDQVHYDCSKALDVNPKYLKALLRRSRAHAHFDNLRDAVHDAIAAEFLFDPDDDQGRRVANIGFQRLNIRFGRQLAGNFLKEELKDDFFQLPPSTNNLRALLANSNHNLFFLAVKSSAKKDIFYSSIVNDMKAEFYDNIANNCTEIIKLNGQHKYLALLLRGAIRFCEHDSVNAFRDFDEILSHVVADSTKKRILKTEALVKRACLKASTGDHDGCLSDLELAKILDSKNASIYHNRAKFGGKNRTSDEVIADYRLAIDLDSTFVAPRLCLADYLCDLKQQQKAEEIFQEAVRLFPQDSEAWRRYAKFLFRMCRLDEALLKIDKAISLAPCRALPYADKAYLLYLTDSGDAETLCRKALHIDEQCHTALCLLGHMKLSDGRYEDAIPFFEKSIKFSPREIIELYMAFGFLVESKTRLKIAKAQNGYLEDEARQ